MKENEKVIYDLDGNITMILPSVIKNLYTPARHVSLRLREFEGSRFSHPVLISTVKEAAIMVDYLSAEIDFLKILNELSQRLEDNGE